MLVPQLQTVVAGVPQRGLSPRSPLCHLPLLLVPLRFLSSAEVTRWEDLWAPTTFS